MVRQLVPRYANSAAPMRYQGADTFMAQHNHKVYSEKLDSRPVAKSYVGEKPHMELDSLLMQNVRKQKEIKQKMVQNSFQGVAPRLRTDTFLINHAKKAPKPVTENIAREVRDPC